MGCGGWVAYADQVLVRCQVSCQVGQVVDELQLKGQHTQDSGFGFDSEASSPLIPSTLQIVICTAVAFRSSSCNTERSDRLFKVWLFKAWAK